MLLASESASEFVKHHVSDHPWPDCQVQVWGMKMTWMSDSIATMVLTACILAVVLPLLARRRGMVPRGPYNAMEYIVVFLRDMVARPALHERAEAFLPFLLTLFFFILGMNLIGLLPTQALSVVVNDWVGVKDRQYTVGASPTGVLTVCAGLAGLTLLHILLRGLWRAARDAQRHNRWLLVPAVVFSPVLWLLSLAPPVEGLTGKLLKVPMAVLEFFGAVAKCFALMVRLFANLMAGHALIAVMMLFVFQASANILSAGLGKAVGLGAICVIASVLLCLLEILVAALQAYIFTYLSAIFLALYAEGQHEG